MSSNSWVLPEIFPIIDVSATVVSLKKTYITLPDKTNIGEGYQLYVIFPYFDSGLISAGMYGRVKPIRFAPSLAEERLNWFL